MAGSKKETATFADEIDDAVLQELYAWIDQIPLSRPKRNLTRDFSDGVLVAETIAHYFPKYVELHNYAPATGTKLKTENWHVLNRKVFKKLHFELADDVIRQIINCKPYVIERVLLMLRTKIDTMMWEKQKEEDDQPEVDQHKSASSLRSQRVSAPLTPKYIDHNQNSSRLPANQKPTSRNQPIRNQGQGQGDNRSLAQQVAGRSILSNEMVPKIQLEEKIQECLVKDETIQILEAKVRRLEHLLHLKDIRINDLQGRVEGVRPTGAR